MNEFEKSDDKWQSLINHKRQLMYILILLLITNIGCSSKQQSVSGLRDNFYNVKFYGTKGDMAGYDDN